MQNIIDIGIALPTTALAWMLLWRDLGIVNRNLGVTTLARRHEGWWRSLKSMDVKVRKQRERFLRAGASDKPSPMMPSDLDERRVAAVIAARGAAAYFGGASAQALLTKAFARYRRWDAELATIPLPAIDFYRYHPDVRKIAPFFAAPGATLCTYDGETTHVLVHSATRPNEDEANREVDL